MKRFALVLIAAAMLALAACSPAADESKAPSDAESSAAVSETESSAEGESSVPEEDSSATAEQGETVDRTQSKVLVSEGCSYTAAGSPHYVYADDGTMLTDGVLGGTVGVGWETSRGSFVLDLGGIKEDLADFDILLRGDSWGIVAPSTAEYYVADELGDWKLVGTVTGDGVTKTPADGDWNEYSYLLQLERGVSGRYVRFDVYGGGMNFAWAHEICVWSYNGVSAGELHDFSGTEAFTNLTMQNGSDDEMGDQEAPGYCVYSKKGYNAAEFVFELSQAEVNLAGSNGSRITAYAFLGVNVFNDGGYWMNCCDAGFAYSNESTGWRLFWATATDADGNRGWFDGGKSLNPSHSYKLTLDTSNADGKATLTAYDIDEDKVADTLEFDLYGSKADGSNTSYLTDIAIDWTGDDTFRDSDGNATTDWVKITEANLGSGMYLRNVRIYGCKLTAGGESFDWTTDRTANRGIWSDADSPITAETTSIHNVTEDMEYIIDLDLS